MMQNLVKVAKSRFKWGKGQGGGGRTCLDHCHLPSRFHGRTGNWFFPSMMSLKTIFDFDRLYEFTAAAVATTTTTSTPATTTATTTTSTTVWSHSLRSKQLQLSTSVLVSWDKIVREKNNYLWTNFLTGWIFLSETIFRLNQTNHFHLW